MKEEECRAEMKDNREAIERIKDSVCKIEKELAVSIVWQKEMKKTIEELKNKIFKNANSAGSGFSNPVVTGIAIAVGGTIFGAIAMKLLDLAF